MPAKRRSFVAVVKAAERALRAAGVDHVFVGALAVGAFGVPRTTTDVDVIAEWRAGDAREIAEAFRLQGLRVSQADLTDALAQRSHCTVHDTLSEFHVDLAPASRATARESLRDLVRLRWRGVTLPIASPEHTIVMKLVFGGEQDLEDAMGIYLRQKGRLDLDRMRDFARRQGVSDALRGLERRAASPNTDR